MAISQVVALKVNGDAYNTVPPNAVGSGAGGNGGSVAKASNTDLLDGVQVSRYSAGVFGSTVLDNDDADKALSAGTFAYNNQKPVAKKVTTALSGVTNLNYSMVLLSAAGIPNIIQSIHYQKVQTMGYNQGVRSRLLTSAIRAGKWNEYSGEFEIGYPAVQVDLWSEDQAALPSRTYPGRLHFKGSSPNPTYADYSKKTG